MKYTSDYVGITTVIIFYFTPALVAGRRYGACDSSEANTVSSNYTFYCSNGNFIPSSYVCDGDDDCDDNSDEAICNFDFNKNIPPLSSDITSVNSKALQWMHEMGYSSSAIHKWGPLVHKSAIALYFVDPEFSGAQKSPVRQEMAYELSVHLLSILAQKGLKDISSSDLASFINALIVTCLNPRSFHGYNLVEELVARVNSQNYTNPYVYIALCNAGETITRFDVNGLNDTFWSYNREVWTDTQALVVMALSCARNQPNSSVSSDMIHGLMRELQQLQYRNGSPGNLHITALVMQICCMI